jgi:hypothetical protein
MSFKALFIAHAPDADKTKHRSRIETGKYILWTVVVKDQAEALEVAKELHEKEGIESIICCPGFTHKDVAELFDAFGGKVSVNVSRGDSPSGRISMEALKREGMI